MKDGYYWVKIADMQWQPTRVEADKCYTSGDAYPWMINGKLVEIGDYIETPDKYKDN